MTMTTKAIVTTCSALFASALSIDAMAAGPGASGDISNETVAPQNTSSETEGTPRGAGDRTDLKWIDRWAPERNMSEFGVFGGILLPARRLELFEPDTGLPDQGYKQFNTVAPSLGLRLGYYPIRFFGVEGEAGVMPTQTVDGLAATLWGMRLGAVGQLGLWSVTPFATIGVGMLNVASDRAAVGNDIDASLHFGGGVKAYLSRYIMLRLDIRDHVTAGQGVEDGVIHNMEALLGLSFTIGRSRAEPPPGPVDTDGDGIYDPDDQCPDVPGVPEYNGCPIPDTDGDTVLDPDDECVDVPGVPEYNGCPIPDTDGDTVLDPDDECPDVPGLVEYNGCPIPDTDGDGILDPDDQCPEQPESKNGYQDEDGCCDVVPQEVRKFTGVIDGIYFSVDRSNIKRRSERVLRKALTVFEKFRDVKIEISGHTDSQGSRPHNLELSQQRAASVKRWLTERGISEDRIITRGAGSEEPIESNETKAGRSMNRRIEFKLQNMSTSRDEVETCDEVTLPNSTNK